MGSHGLGIPISVFNYINLTPSLKSLSFVILYIIWFIRADRAREIRAVSFELGSHYQMMGTNPEQNFGVVLLNSYPVCLHQAAL
ncbi:hypothetical protein VNO78_17897 [Psophocarpus tetragonolobus]|uniref:Uncharacterized protein n=1 Tax=Psophocarpus tetragonolobus TaxID=3891 RepID=A0AAN9SJL4_PSOTE